jgi:hypothetical protein
VHWFSLVQLSQCTVRDSLCEIMKGVCPWKCQQYQRKEINFNGSFRRKNNNVTKFICKPTIITINHSKQQDVTIRTDNTSGHKVLKSTTFRARARARVKVLRAQANLIRVDFHVNGCIASIASARENALRKVFIASTLGTALRQDISSAYRYRGQISNL